MILLRIGELDLTQWLEREKYKVERDLVTDEEFTNYTGETIKKALGFRYNISFSLTLVPDEFAKQLGSVLVGENFNVEFRTPFDSSNVHAVFLKPEKVNSVLNLENSDGLYWNFDVNLVSAYIADYGL